MRNRTRSLHLSLCEVYPHCHPPSTPTLFTQSAFPILWAAHQERSVGMDTPGKELWHGVISSGCPPSADVRKQIHSCRWDFVLRNSVRRAVELHRPRRLFFMWMLNNSDVACYVYLCLCLFSLRKLWGWRYQSEARIAFSGHGDSTFSLQNNLYSLHSHFPSAGTIGV